MTLPHVRHEQGNPEHHSRLSQWLGEWALFRALAPDASSAEDHRPTPLATPSDRTAVQPGDIRLLHPSIEPNAPRYVAVIESAGREGWRVAPFGLLAEPATPEEVATGRTAPGLRVLCAWNRFDMPASSLQTCWLADRLSEAEQDVLLTPLRGSPVEGSAAWPPERVGPPLSHPLDPRWDYLEMESELRHRASQTPRRGVVYDIGDGELRKAAEGRAPYGSPDRDGEPDEDAPTT